MKTPQLTFGRIFWRTLVLFRNTLKFNHIYLVYALLMTISTVLFGRLSFSCDLEPNSWWCYSTKNSYVILSLYVANLLILLYFLLSFCYDIFVCTNQGIKMQLKNIIPDKKRIRAIGAMVAVFMLLVIPMIVVMGIFIKPANPNWKIEFIYFLICFVCCWIPFITMRLSMGLSYFLSNNKLPDFKCIWQETNKKSFAIVIVYALVFLIFNIIGIKFGLFIKSLIFSYNNFGVAVLAELISNLYLLGVFAFILMIFRAQQTIVDDKNLCSSEAREDVVLQKNNTEVPTEENQVSTVKKMPKSKKSGKKTSKKKK